MHVMFALTSLVSTGLTYIVPTRRKLFVSSALVGLTLGSGTVLVIALHSPLVNSCIAGLAYLGAVSFGIYAAQRKLAQEH